MSALVTSRRVWILVQVADHIAKDAGYDPERDARRIAEHWRNADEADRSRLFVVHAAMKPDEVAFRLFVEALEGRAARVAGVSP